MAARQRSSGVWEYFAINATDQSKVSCSTVPVNKKFTFRFKKTIVLRLTILSKNGTTTERKCNGHAIRKRNGTYKKTERTTDRLHTKCKTSAKRFSRVSCSFRVSVAVFEWARLFKARVSEEVVSTDLAKQFWLVCLKGKPVWRKWAKHFQVTTVPASGFVTFTVVYQDPLLAVTGKSRLQIHTWNSNDFGKNR